MTKLSDVVTVAINTDSPKPQIPSRSGRLDCTYKIAGRDFRQYINRRMLKDGIGFIRKDNYQDSSTDLYNYIAAPVPKTDSDFLAYCHELGHCKSRQYVSSTNFYNATWDGKWSMERLVSEVNAWKWAIRYFRRLGCTMGEETVKVVQWALNSYFKNAADFSVASKLSEEFEAYSGITTEKYKPFVSISNTTFFTYPAKPVKIPVVTEKPKGWKPWHDLKQKQMKKQWKHCK